MVMFRFHPRANSAVLAAPLLLLIVVIYVFSDDVSRDLDGYWTAATAKAASALMFIAPVTAACAAWEVGRIRRARIGAGTPTRNGWQIAAAALAPVVLLGFLALAVALAGARLQMDSAPGWPDAGIIASTAVTLCAHIIVGYAVGLWLPAVASVPMVLVGDYLWHVYPPALQPLWLRHLTEPARGCCMNTDAADVAGIVGSALVAIGLAALAVAAVAGSRHTPRLGHVPDSVPYTAYAVALVAAMATTAGSVSLVDKLGPDAVRARSATDLVCVNPSGTRVCVWPEHAPRLNETARTVSTAVERLRLVGVPAPDVVTEGSRQSTQKQWTVTVRQDPSFTSQDILASLTADLTMVLVTSQDNGTPANCPADPTQAAQQAFQAESELRSWLSVHAGMSPQEAQRRSDIPQTWPSVSRVLAANASSQKDWYRSTLAKVRCMPR
ncbi:hypothetical protein [Streptomyces sp. TRM68367]|uniref:DUF7224 domain-containing protein n=1 Tax=Streptomyces sp. TRM68367 TaxID=2758415 RepID=UPI00199EA7CE|nr:hypothetical protein [Streptomyces sp. TRM68367]MBC9729973.1 hypothetical protein [Streptomyces sp. TRM68367]